MENMEVKDIKELRGENVLVTGGTGFVGSHLVEGLLGLGARVVTTYEYTDPLSYFITEGLDKKVVMEKMDVRDFDGVFDLVTKFDIDYIFHLAAQAIVGVAYDNPRRTLESNINGTINVLESARLFPKVKAVVVASSDKAYGKMESEKYHESNSLSGDHPYDVSKSAADLIAYSYFKTYGLSVVTTRFGNVYGEGDLNFSRIIPGIIRSILTNEVLELRSDGKMIRDYLYVKDVVKGYLLLAQKIEGTKGEAFNFGSEDTLTVLELIDVTGRTLGIDIPYRILNTARNEVPYQSLNYEKVMKLGWKPEQSIESTVVKVLEWYSKLGLGRVTGRREKVLVIRRPEKLIKEVKKEEARKTEVAVDSQQLTNGKDLYVSL